MERKYWEKIVVISVFSLKNIDSWEKMKSFFKHVRENGDFDISWTTHLISLLKTLKEMLIWENATGNGVILGKNKLHSLNSCYF